MEYSNQFEYAGFWVRLGAALIDTILFLMLTMPLLYWIYGNYYFESESFILGGWDLLLNWLFPFIATVLFWVYRSATPGKIALKLKVVDAKTGEALSTSKSILRYVAYYVSTIPLCLGFIWVAFNGKKQGWHDMIASTVVIRPKDRSVEAVEFEKRA
ncbi:RDD family protein [Vibrio clamense]|uniref:RDD family protein n=1 Tax=Vibrio clamense TaxID=2910254 RepID=UPI003D23C1B2